MHRLRAALSTARLRNAPVILLAGVVLCAGDGSFHFEISGKAAGSAFSFIGSAAAGENDDGQHRKHRSSDDGAGKGGSLNGWQTGGVAGGGDNKPKASGQGEAPHSEGHRSLSYDANHNMMKLHLKLDAGREHHGDRHDAAHSIMRERLHHESPAWTIGRGHRGDERHEFNSIRLHGLQDSQEGWKERHSLEFDRSLKPVETRYRTSVFEKDSATTIMAKTRLPIGGLLYVPNEVLAVGMDRQSIERAEALGFKADQPLISESSEHTIIRFTVPKELDAVRAQDILSRELPGQRFELNKVYRLYHASARDDPVTLDKGQGPPVPGSGSACAGNTCFAREAIGWKDGLAPCARGLKVGVIDTDIDQSHPAFAGRNIHRFDFAPEGRRLAPNWHGTAVLSLLAGNPQTNTPGLIPEAEFFAANVFFSDERGEMAADTMSIVNALDWMTASRVGLVNMSFSGPRDGLVADAIERMSEKGTVFVAAAGNEGPAAAPAYPAAYPQVIAVTAVTKDMRNYRYANRGEHIDVAAPGVDIWTAAPGGRGAFHSGTSFAAPYVTAVMAVESPDTLKQEKADLLDGLPVIDLGGEGRDPVYGRGLLLAPSECTAPPAPDAVASAAE